MSQQLSDESTGKYSSTYREGYPYNALFSYGPDKLCGKGNKDDTRVLITDKQIIVKFIINQVVHVCSVNIRQMFTPPSCKKSQKDKHWEKFFVIPLSLFVLLTEFSKNCTVLSRFQATDRQGGKPPNSTVY